LVCSAAPLPTAATPKIMLVLRIFGALLVITLGVSLVGYVLTRDRRWLRFAIRGLVIGLVIALIFMVLYALERLFLAV
jgi:FtsH-binding integral membrane protein